MLENITRNGRIENQWGEKKKRKSVGRNLVIVIRTVGILTKKA